MYKIKYTSIIYHCTLLVNIKITFIEFLVISYIKRPQTWRFLNIFLGDLCKKIFFQKISKKVLTNEKNSDIIVKRSAEEDMAE